MPDVPTPAAAPEATDERGQGLVEYALILSFIVIVVILMVTLLGHSTANLYSNISSGIGA
jgi:Flp pilus assembly pilin Flp